MQWAILYVAAAGLPEYNDYAIPYVDVNMPCFVYDDFFTNHRF